MRVVDLIQKKKEGRRFTQEEMSFFIRGFTNGEIPDYQMASYLMACYFRKLDFEETMQMTQEMLHSGKIIDLSAISLQKIDKHSTGGVGDKTSLIIAPMVASCGIVVPMISGRGLGHTGGTVDKLESIPGFNMNLKLSQFQEYLSRNCLAMMGQTSEIAPADKKIYALRDVTATVDCIPLIAASIMSKKLAEGVDGIVLDVKFGRGAFMQPLSEAKELARWLVKIGKSFGKKMVALVTDMNQPLGNKVGNSLEVEEAIDLLKGKGPKDIRELSLLLAAHMIQLGKGAKSLKEGIKIAQESIQRGIALQKFRKMIEIQGGDVRVVDSFKFLPKAEHQIPFQSTRKGYITVIDAKKVGLAACVLGCGRERVEDVVDPAVGFTFYKKVGEFVERGETLLTIHYNDENKKSLAEEELMGAYRIESKKKKPDLLVREVIGI